MRNVERQGGSVAVFVVTGVVLVLVALGVMYGMKQVAMQGQTSPTMLPGATDSSNQSDDKASQDDKLADQGAGDQQPGEDQSGQKPEDTKSDSTDTSNGVSGENPSEPAPSTGQSASPDDNLPQSGPSETFVTMIALSSVAATSVAYLRSRHP